MKIELEKINNIRKILNNINEDSVVLDDSKAIIVFPIDDAIKKEIDGIEFMTKANNGDSYGIVEAGLSLDGELVYFEPNYIKKFNFINFCNLIEKKLNKKMFEELHGLDCYLVDKNYIFLKCKI